MMGSEIDVIVYHKTIAIIVVDCTEVQRSDKIGYSGGSIYGMSIGDSKIYCLYRI